MYCIIFVYQMIVLEYMHVLDRRYMSVRMFLSFCFNSAVIEDRNLLKCLVYCFISYVMKITEFIDFSY